MNIFTKFTKYIHYVPIAHHPCPHLDPYIIMAMCPITHVPIAHVAFCPCAPLPYSHVDLEGDIPHCPYAPSLLFPITYVPNHPTHCAHVPHCSCGLLPMHPITLLPCRSRISHATFPICPSPLFPWVMGHTGDGAAKCQMMSSCHKDVKCQKIKYLDYGGGSQK